MNRPNLGFEEAESELPTQEFEISEGKVGEPLGLRLVKFQGVQSLHVSFAFLFALLVEGVGEGERGTRSRERERERKGDELDSRSLD